jgi:hypothetical protein
MPGMPAVRGRCLDGTEGNRAFAPSAEFLDVFMKNASQKYKKILQEADPITS